MHHIVQIYCHLHRKSAEISSKNYQAQCRGSVVMGTMQKTAWALCRQERVVEAAAQR